MRLIASHSRSLPSVLTGTVKKSASHDAAVTGKGDADQSGYDEGWFVGEADSGNLSTDKRILKGGRSWQRKPLSKPLTAIVSGV